MRIKTRLARTAVLAVLVTGGMVAMPAGAALAGPPDHANGNNGNGRDRDGLPPGLEKRDEPPPGHVDNDNTRHDWSDDEPDDGPAF